MRKYIILTMLFVFITTIILAQTPTKPNRVAGRHKIELEDPLGDVQENDGKPGKDVVRVAITSDGENLNIVAELEKKVSYYLKDQLAGPVIELHLNTDNNAKTGGVAFWGKNKIGFEYQLDVVACITYKSGGLACLGAAGKDIDGFISSYKLSKYEQDKKMPQAINSTLSSTQKEITGKEVEITVPYSEIGIKSGTRMMISIRESDSTFDDASYFPQVFFIVK